MGLKLFTSLPKDVQGKTLRDVVRALYSLSERFYIDCNTKAEMIDRQNCALLRTILLPQQQSMMDARNIKTKEDLMELADSLDAIGVAQKIERFDKPLFSQSQGYGSRGCFKCGKPGHRFFECRARVSIQSQRENNSSPRVVTCFLCGVQGHKSPDCPNKMASGETARVNVKQSMPDKKVNFICAGREGNSVQGFVNDCEAHIELDTGADISVVPDNFVCSENMNGGSVTLRVLTGDRYCAPTANVVITIGSNSFEEVVAVVPKTMLRDRIILSVALDTSKFPFMQVIKQVPTQADKQQEEATGPLHQVLQVETRSKAMAHDKNEEDQIQSEYQGVKPNPMDIGELRDVVREVVQDEECDVGQMGEVYGESLADEVDCLGEVEEEGVTTKDEEVRKVVDSGMLESNDEIRVNIGEAEENRDAPELGVPDLYESADKNKLCEEILQDQTLATCRALADKGERGYFWRDNLLFHRQVDDILGVNERLVVPTSRRRFILELAHDRTGHLGTKKVRAVVGRKFTWPNVARDCEDYCCSCLRCGKANKASHPKATLVERPILSEPFESVALDIVGPLPKGKGGARYILTMICLASKWPDAVALKSITAKSVAEGCVEMFSRTGLPLRILTDQGRQFVSQLMKEVCSLCGIDRVQSTPYHPQTNGALERLHGTLKPILTKARNQGLDWVSFLPMALFALRQVPSADLGYSPHELVYGRQMRGPLDLLYAGWVDDTFRQVGVSQWVGELQDKLAVIHDCVHVRGSLSRQIRQKLHNRGKVERSLDIGDKVLLRIPGMVNVLEESWEGPFVVKERLSKVNYRVVEEGSRKRGRVVHINNCKLYKVRDCMIGSIVVIAEECVNDKKCPLLEVKCDGYDDIQLKLVLDEFQDVFSEIPGNCDVVKMSIELDSDAKVLSKRPYQIPVRLREGVKKEIESLLELGIIEPSSSSWSSPIVPVSKPDGSVRICVDFRGLNDITPQQQWWIPTLDEILEKAGNARVMSKLDLAKGFHQIQMDEDSKQYTTFVCPFGKFCFKRMPFGLKNAPAVFQAAVEQVLSECKAFSTNYIDDILIYSECWDDHVVHIRLVLEALRGAGLTVKRGKCEWGGRYIDYLGHRVGCGQLAVPDHRVAALRDFRQPKTQKDLRAFLGSVGYYRKFIVGFANLSAILTPATSSTAPRVVQWTQEMEAAFCELKCVLANHVVLNVPQAEDQFILHTDASGVGVGAVLNIIKNGVEVPVAFYSRQLRGAELRYSVTELESLAIVCSIDHFTHYLYGRQFIVVTDHKPCCALLSSSHLNRCLRGMALKLQGMSVKIVYRPGTDHANADGFSRQSWSDIAGDGLVTSSTEPEVQSCQGEMWGQSPASQ